MKSVILDPYNKEHKNIIDRSLKKQVFKGFMNISSIYRKEEYEEIKNKRNEIIEYLLEIEDEKIKNYCFFTGTKDNRLIQIGIENLLEKSFLEESINYAFQVLNAYTITIFSDVGISNLEKMGFEFLGEEDGVITYVKEREINLQVEKVR